MNLLSPVLLDRVSVALRERGIAHGPLVEGAPHLNLNAGDGARVFVKVTRLGESPRRPAAEVAGAARALRHGIAAPEALLPEVVEVRDETGQRRYVTAWQWLDLAAAPSLDRCAETLVDLLGQVSQASPPVGPVLEPDDFMDRVVARLVGRRDEVAEHVRATAMRSWLEARGRVAAAPRHWIHADLHLRNIGWRRDGSPVLLDWESNVLGPVEWDVAQMIRSMYIYTPGATDAERDRSAARVVALVTDRFDLDWTLVAAVLRLRAASNASHLLVHGHDAAVLRADLRLVDTDLDWLAPAAKVA